MLYWGARLNGLNLESGADVGQHRGAEWERFGVVLLPSLVLGAEVEGTGVLQIGGEHNRLVAGLAGELYTQVPGIEGDENEVEILRCQVLGGERVESVDSISKGTSVPNVFPSQGRQACCVENIRQ
jgi:hypothetical protein